MFKHKYVTYITLYCEFGMKIEKIKYMCNAQ